MPSLFTDGSLQLARRGCERLSGGRRRSFRTAYAVLLAGLIRDHAHRGVAHVVGLSLGAVFALGLAAHAPERVLSIFVSGLPPRVPSMPAWLRPIASGPWWAIEYASGSLGPRATERMLNGLVSVREEGWDGKGGRATFETVDLTAESLGLSAPRIDGGATPVGNHGRRLRVHIVAATKRLSWMPTGDSVPKSISAARLIIGAGDGQPGDQHIHCTVSEAPGMLHPWARQRADVFAECIEATIAGDKLPAEHIIEKWDSLHAAT